MPKPSDFLSTTQLAEILGISRVAVFKKIKSGEIPAEKVGRNYIINKNVLGTVLDKKPSETEKKDIDLAVKKTVKEYGETLKLLGTI